ncbi:uncharacterized protein LOC134538941 [Bacillus rossius redtenbacheri]|uniref:uncharacterized protein LOC134538941 n=1 Tax=Bacillus rossius redtenbacheri TaxID=93214 RepID=UPI002FDE884F
MKLFAALFFVLVLTAVCNGGYPKITAIFADPRRYSGRFLSGRYDANEIYSFRKNVSLDAVIVPTRISPGDQSEEYAETYRILVEAADDLGDYGYHEDVGVGYFNGTARTGSAISVPIVSIRDPEHSLVAAPTRNGSVLRYVVYVEYGSMRMAYYPEFSNRSLDFLDVFSNQPSAYGVVVGLEYSHP